MLLDRHKLSPYVGRTFRGVVKRTIVRGHTVFHDGKTRRRLPRPAGHARARRGPAVLEQIVRGPLLMPREGGAVDFHADGVLADGRRA